MSKLSVKIKKEEHSSKADKKEDNKEDKNGEDKKGEDKKEEDKKPADQWNAAIGANVIVALLGVVEFFLCLTAQMWDGKYMKVIEGYDHGNLLYVLGFVGLIAAMVGAYGVALCAYCKTPAKARRLRYMVYAYFGWGGGTIFLLFVSFGLTFSESSHLEVVFRPGFSKYITKYQKEEAVRSAVDYLQQKLKCCGNMNYTDWFTVTFSDKVSRTETAIPESCCRQTPCTEIVPSGEADRLTPYTTGCTEAVVKQYGWTLNLRAMLLLTTAIVETGALVLILMEVRRSPPPTVEPPSPVELKKEETQQLITKPSLQKKRKKRRKDGGSSIKIDGKTKGEKSEWDGSEYSKEGKEQYAAAAVPGRVHFTPDTLQPGTVGFQQTPPGNVQPQYTGVGYAPDYSMNYQ